ncbi:MAG: PucR family transcriptional regulator ligand-binding domain-containing protein [Synergistaceae bacterium]|nr:PucR family transcriptional regulator ligand-binding domain-containing protein [Synergistaceae bacterium]
MPLTVSQILRIESLKGTTLLAGEKGARQRTVSTVVVIDTPEAHQWLRGGEFLISSGYIFCEKPLELRSFIEGAGRSQAAAFGIKIGRYLGKIPIDILDSANRLNFPLIGIPEHFNHVDIIQPVIATIMHDDHEQLVLKNKINDVYLDLLLNGATIDDIICKTSELIDANITFSRNRTDVSFFAKNNNYESDNFNDSGSFHIAVNGKLRASLCVRNRGESISDAELSTITSLAKKYISILIQREDAEIQIENYHLEDFLKNLLYNKNINEYDIKRKSKFYKWDLSWKLSVSIIKNNPDISKIKEDKSLFESLLLRMKSKFSGSLGLASDHDLVLFVPLKASSDLDNVFKYIKETILSVNAKKEFNLMGGLSSAKDGLFLAREAFSEAQKALDVVMRTSGYPPVRLFDEIGLDGILSVLKNTEMGQSFIEKQLGPLLNKNNSQKRFNFMETLEALVRYDWQIAPAAADLNLHYNTMKYRIRCLEEMLRLADHDGRRRMELALAVLLYQIDKKPPLS